MARGSLSTARRTGFSRTRFAARTLLRRQKYGGRAIGVRGDHFGGKNPAQVQRGHTVALEFVVGHRGVHLANAVADCGWQNAEVEWSARTDGRRGAMAFRRAELVGSGPCGNVEVRVARQAGQLDLVGVDGGFEHHHFTLRAGSVDSHPDSLGRLIRLRLLARLGWWG